MTSRSAERTVNEMHALLRGELSAVEAYDLAIRRVRGAPPADDLLRLRDRHVAAAAVLRRFASPRVRAPSSPVRPWAAFFRASEADVDLRENRAAIRALRHAEEVGTAAYERFLRHPDLEAEVRRAVGLALLPEQRGHVAVLDAAFGAA